MQVIETTRRKSLPGEGSDDSGLYWCKRYAPYFEDYPVEAWERMTEGGVTARYGKSQFRVIIASIQDIVHWIPL